MLMYALCVHAMLMYAVRVHAMLIHAVPVGALLVHVHMIPTQLRLHAALVYLHASAGDKARLCGGVLSG